MPDLTGPAPGAIGCCLPPGWKPTHPMDLPKLYIKPGCPWCDDVIDYLASGKGAGGFREKFESFVAALKEGDETVLLMKPLTVWATRWVASR